MNLNSHPDHHGEYWAVMKKIAPEPKPEAKVSCRCNPETGETCMLHWDMDEWLLAFTAANQKTESEIQHDKTSEADR